MSKVHELVGLILCGLLAQQPTSPFHVCILEGDHRRCVRIDRDQVPLDEELAPVDPWPHASKGSHRLPGG